MRVVMGWIGLTVLTIVGLGYTHQQIAMVGYSYRLSERLTERDRLYEQYVYLDYDLMALKAPNRLRERLASLDIQLAVPETTRIIATSGHHE